MFLNIDLYVVSAGKFLSDVRPMLIVGFGCRSSSLACRMKTLVLFDYGNEGTVHSASPRYSTLAP